MIEELQAAPEDGYLRETQIGDPEPEFVPEEEA